MQKIFIVKETLSPINEHGNYSVVNKFIKDKGKIISVTNNIIASGTDGRQGGRWLVVADDGQSLTL